MGASTDCPCAVNFTTSPFATPSLWAEAGLTSAALSQVSLVRGLGTSCNQPLLAKLPSPMEGSGRRTISIPPAFALAAPLSEVLDLTVFGGRAVFATTPSFSEVCQNWSKSAPGFCFCQSPRTTSCPVVPAWPASTARISCADLPSYNG